ncbi:MAG: DAK2 domain-containing protein [Chloroflexi bacterium]|nr:DAK2 domain-containing protein [Chloroflexota bacterium]
MSEEAQQPALPPLKSIGGQEIKQLFAASLAWLERHCAYVNSLNVFPVPDGDSGTNMLMTMQAAMKEVNNSPAHSAAAIGAALSHGALLGARGNSGVILSQIIRGFTRAIEGKETIDAKDFAAGMVEASKTAYKGVVKPVEGTILTVCREASDGAVAAAKTSDDLRVVLAQTVDAARASVVRTPTLLPVLREAGVVDAGGQGLLVVLEGALKYLNGEPLELEAGGMGAQNLEMISREEGWGYDIQFHIRGQNLDVDAIREKISAMGESALIVGDETLVKVHVHAPNPGEIIRYGADLGGLANVIIENMQEQYIDFMAGQTASARPPMNVEDVAGIFTVAVAPGAGLARVFDSMGAGAVISGGQTKNPSIEELLNAINSAKSNHVIILPNNKNIIPAAEQAKQLAQKRVAVVPTKTVPQGIAALLAFNFQSDLDTNARGMLRAAEKVDTLEVTTATRSVTLDGVPVTEGQAIGIVNGKLAGASDDRDEITLRLLDEMGAAKKEIVTIYYGDNVAPEQANAFGNRVQAALTGLQVEVMRGDQPHYHYIISVE